MLCCVGSAEALKLESAIGFAGPAPTRYLALLKAFESASWVMRGRLPSDLHLNPEDLALLERVFAQVILQHDMHP